MQSPGARAAFWVGVREAVVVVPSYLPFALVCGVASVNAGLTTGAALALPALVFAGSSQAVLT
ncbi:MAG: branched-chain amino acid ABC transporter permease, partial [Rhodoferax sp.]|nr:branched-chain amino acid ABC transporter permease [Rhodoferax sp.]